MRLKVVGFELNDTQRCVLTVIGFRSKSSRVDAPAASACTKTAASSRSRRAFSSLTCSRAASLSSSSRASSCCMPKSEHGRASGGRALLTSTRLAGSSPPRKKPLSCASIARRTRCVRVLANYSRWLTESRADWLPQGLLGPPRVVHLWLVAARDYAQAAEATRGHDSSAVRSEHGESGNIFADQRSLTASTTRSTPTCRSAAPMSSRSTSRSHITWQTCRRLSSSVWR